MRAFAPPFLGLLLAAGVVAGGCAFALVLIDNRDLRQEVRDADAEITLLGEMLADTRAELAACSVEPTVGPGFTKSWSKTCATASASTIVPAGVNVAAFECQAPEVGETDATQLVAIGDSLIADPAFATRNSPVICGSGCSQTSKSINAKQAYCRTDTDDVVLYCWGIATVGEQP